ncbi:SMP-30/gluconolactonase/LRE family protein [Hymenobacter gummosus]|uniref:SMP-30/gluconolactonase/LRE family protein n=1 Tax=Hymenobacter gummosus TaxID=1776032 RepID=A0A3S0HKS5_9BACT|nr:SMP-30/gluconolactonase/LRE family protein [Hymenobacter gummosus]RTQ46878.1 SMP-30/gluconolactonase/LRE family protein [Hymenobacter gummosus]
MRFLPRLLLLLLPGAALAQTPPPTRFTTTGHIERKAPGLDALLAPDAQVEILASGLGHPEGPVWVADSSMLLFTDAPTSTVYRWSAGRGLTKFLEHSGYTGRLPYSRETGANGLALDGRGNLLLCEHGDRRLARLPLGQPSGKLTLTDHYQGRRYNSPNDVAVQPGSGIIFFTDPPYGLPRQENDPLRETPTSGLYRLRPDGKVTLMAAHFTRPNGLGFSADGRTLYVAQSDSLKPLIMAYPVNAKGRLGTGRLFFDLSQVPKVRPKEVPDGLAVDRAGNVWASGPGGLLILSPQGQHLGTIDPGEVVANCAFGDDGRTLYLTVGTWLCRIRTLSSGF